MGYAETVTENAQNALWQGLKAYDEVMGQNCPEDEYDIEACEAVQDVTNELTPQLIIIGKILGYEEAAIDVVMELITDYHHHEKYQSHMDEARLADYDCLYTWLSGDERTTPFQDVVLTGIVCQLG